jgi:hypothetical protein
MFSEIKVNCDIILKNNETIKLIEESTCYKDAINNFKKSIQSSFDCFSLLISINNFDKSILGITCKVPCTFKFIENFYFNKNFFKNKSFNLENWGGLYDFLFYLNSKIENLLCSNSMSIDYGSIFSFLLNKGTSLTNQNEIEFRNNFILYWNTFINTLNFIKTNELLSCTKELGNYLINKRRNYE